MSDEDLEKLVDKVHLRNLELCKGKFITRAGMIQVVLVALTILATCAGGSIAWAMNTQSKLGAVESTTQSLSSKIDGLSVRVQQVDTKVDQVLLAVARINEGAQ